MTEELTPVDPFDLPEWLGVADVTWSAQDGLHTGHAVRGALVDDDHHQLACDLLAIDQAYPAPIASDAVRLLAHQAWRNGEVHLVRRQRRLALAVPGTAFSADLALDAFSRLARAVGASTERYAVLLRIGDGAR